VEGVLMVRVLVSCHRQEAPLVSATAQAAFAPLRVHRPTPTAVRVKQSIASACLCTIAPVPLPTQAMLVAGMWFPAVWRVEREMLVPQGRVEVSVAVPVRRLRFAALPGQPQTT
jgi:hypothetical protein